MRTYRPQAADWVQSEAERQGLPDGAARSVAQPRRSDARDGCLVDDRS
jgi:hypothetical protein